MSTLLAVRTNRNGRRTVHLPWRDRDDLDADYVVRVRVDLPTRCGWYGTAVYSSTGDSVLGGAVACRRCFPDGGGT